MKRAFKIILFILIILFTVLAGVLIWYQYKRTYRNSDFGIEDIQSNIDYDKDGIDDYTDIFIGAVNYVKTKPKYKSKYYNGGYPTDNYGVCTDVIWKAFEEAGYNLKDMIDEDIEKNKDDYDIKIPDKNIDFRRVKNLKVFFDKKATILSNDIENIEEFQAGDIIVFNKHIAIISNKRNKKGIPYIIHNSGNLLYEEDAIWRYDIIGHYRWDGIK